MTNRAHNFKDLTGNRYGRLTVLGLAYIKSKMSYWDCQCDCGNKTIKYGQNITRGSTSSCGCLSLETKRINKGRSGFNALYLEYVSGATKRGYCFDLSKDEFEKLTKQKCHYCKAEPIKEKCLNNTRLTDQGAKYSAYIYNGIDRKDNKTGYVLENCVTCCNICNRAKGNLEYNVFVEYIDRIKALS